MVNFWAAYAYIKSQFDPPLYLEILNCQKSSNLTDQKYTQMSLSTFSWNLCVILQLFFASTKGKKSTSFSYTQDIADLSFWSIWGIARHGRSGEVPLSSTGVYIIKNSHVLTRIFLLSPTFKSWLNSLTTLVNCLRGLILKRWKKTFIH